ncbi:MAG: hypothetical protein IKT68_00520 [Clostridia bacterium]|nr:hypothetical protein [Clostridia bacterium]
MKILYKSILVLLCVGLLMSIIGCSENQEGTVDGVKKWTLAELNTGTQYKALSVDAETGMDVVASNNAYDMLFDQDNATIGIRDKATGYVWKTNSTPDDFTGNMYSLSEQEREYCSQLQLTYYDHRHQPVNYNSFEHAVMQNRDDDKRMYFYGLNNGMRIVYVIGQSEEAFYVPTYMFKEDFDALVNAIPQEAIDKFIAEGSDYGASTLDVYYDEFDYDFEILNTDQAIINSLTNSCENFGPGKVLYKFSAASNFVTSEIYRKLLRDLKDEKGNPMITNEYIKKVYENVGYDYEEPDHPKFTIAMDFVLTADGLKVDVDTEKVIYEDSFKLNNLQILPCFGTVLDNKESKILLPDGSGTLVDVLNPSSDKALSLPFYGNDYSYEVTDYALGMQQASLPVYGLTRGDNAFVAYVSDGEAIGSVKCQPVTETYAHSFVGCYFTVQPFEERRSNGASAQTTMKMFASDPYRGKITLEYMFLGDQNGGIDYVEMAQAVRNKLFNNRTKVADDTTRFYMETYGAVLRKENFLGYAYNDTTALTTFDQAKSMYTTLNENGITNIAVRYNNWYGDAFVNQISDIGKVESEVGGSDGMKEFMSFVAGKKGLVYPNVELIMEEYSNSLIDATWHSKYMGGTMVAYSDMNLYAEGVTAEFERLVVKSDVMLEDLPDIMERVNKLQTTGLSVSTLGDQLFSDYTSDEVRYRDTVKDDYVTAIKQLKETNKQKLLFDGGNAYVLPYADDLMNVAISSSNHYLSEADVPFMQIVLHGYIPYAASSMNLSDNYDVQLLKSVEYGANLAYTLNYANAEMVKNTNYSELYSTNFDHWKSQAVADYKKVAAVLDGCQSATIQDHTQLAEGVYKTTYDNGVSVLVNYNNQAYTDAATGTTVEAMNFARVGKEG